MEDQPSSVKKVKAPRWEYAILGAIVVLLICLAFIGSVMSQRSKEPVRVSDRFIYALLSEDTDVAYELTAEPYRQTVGDEQFATVVEEFSRNYKTSPKLIEQRIQRASNGSLFATVEYRLPGATDNRLVVKLVEEGNAWRVLNINNSP